MRLAIDFANYTAIPTPEQVAQLKALGVEQAIVGVSYGAIASQQIAALEAGGIPCADYEFPEAIKDASDPIWLDAETAGATVAALRTAFSSGKFVGLYTRRGFWTSETGDWDISGAFPSLRLWDARYVHGDNEPCDILEAVDGGGDVRAAVEAEYARQAPFVPYGGFQAAAITQWHNSITIYGLNVDLDALEGDMDAPTRGEFGALFGLVVQQSATIKALGGGLVAVAQTVGTDDAKLTDMRKELDALEAHTASLPAPK